MIIEEKMRTILTEHLHPIFLNIKNESALHSMQGSETHFRLEIVSDVFLGKKQLERHRLVQKILNHELSSIKAFSLHTFTAEEWEKKNRILEKSPSCRGAHE